VGTLGRFKPFCRLAKLTTNHFGFRMDF